jgi:protein phosphatase PTC2/3
MVRNYNEDRVSIILNIVKPEHRAHEEWPKCSFFGVYDGHGGSACAEFLRDNLHNYVIKEDVFPFNPNLAIQRGFKQAENSFLDMCQSFDEATGQRNVIERSGSCAIVVLIVGEVCYVANVGDSRAVLSSETGKKLTALSRDQKPSDVDEHRRIVEAGGQVY